MKTFKYFGSLVTYQNSIQGKIKCRLIAVNSCYYLVQTVFFFRIPSKNLKIKIYKTIILPGRWAGHVARMEKGRRAFKILTDINRLDGA